jgi:hypothetical protein
MLGSDRRLQVCNRAAGFPLALPTEGAHLRSQVAVALPLTSLIAMALQRDDPIAW